MIAVVAFIVPVFIGIFEEIAAETPGESAELPFLTKITKGISDCAHPQLVLRHRRADHRHDRLPALEDDRGRAGASGTGSSCAFRSTSATSPTRSRWRAGRARSRAPSPPACRSCSRSRSPARPSGNTVVEEAMDDVYDSVKSGGSIAEPLEEHRDLPADGLPHGRGRRGDRPARRRCSPRSPTSTRPRSTRRSRR